MKQFLDIQGGIWRTGKTVNKVVSAMSSAQNQNGGQEATILSLYTTMMHWRAIIAQLFILMILYLLLVETHMEQV